MVPEFRLGEEFFASLFEWDAEIARQVAAGGCPRCGGPLHQGNYERKVRGGLIAVAGEAFSIRHSLCCGAEGCRRRCQPPSVRFLGRRVYLEAVVVLGSVLSQLAGLGRAVVTSGVPRWTLRRWLAWWRDDFARSAVWTELQARFRPPPPEPASLPHSLVSRLERELRDQAEPSELDAVCRWLARYLAPATAGAALEGSRLSREIPTLAADGPGHAKDVAPG